MKLKKILLPSLLVCAALALSTRAAARPALAQPASNNANYDAIDAYIEQQMRCLNLPGVSLAIVEGDQIVHLRGFGRAYTGGKAPTPQMPFMIGSLTKSITALAVMQLVEAGMVELDAPVQRYLPWFQVADPQASAQITLRHLLNQTSSLPLLPAWQLLADFDDRPGAAERQARGLSTLKLSRPVGSAFEYSNLNYNLLGLVIEAVSGETYSGYIQNHIFTPLKMRHSYTSKAAAQRDGLAVGHQSWFTIPVAAPHLPIPNGSVPAGGLISSAEDMAHYLIAHLNGGRYEGTPILSPQGIAELHRGNVEVIQMGIPFGSYGMGWYVDEQGGTRVDSHSGMMPEFYSYMALLPERRKGIVMLVNANHFTMEATMAEVGSGLTALLAGNPPAPIQFGAIPWVQRGLLLIPLLQIAGVVATLGLLRRWERQPQRRPSLGRAWALYILPAVVSNLLLFLAPLYLLANRLIGFTLLFAADFAWISLLSGGFAGIWVFLRPVLILRALRNPETSPSFAGELAANG